MIKKITAGLLIIGLMATSLITAPFNLAGTVAEAATNDTVKISTVPQDITQPRSKPYTLSESMNSIWIPVNVSKKGIVNFVCSTQGNSESVFIALYEKKDVNAEREYNIINGESAWNVSVSKTDVSYIYVEKGVNDRGKSVTVTISTSFVEETQTETLKPDKEYNIIRSEKNVDYKFTLKKPQKISFKVNNSVAYLLDSEKNICCNDISGEEKYLDKGTYYLRIKNSGIHTVSYSSKNVSPPKTSNATKKKAKTIKLDKKEYFTYKKSSKKEMWYKVKSNKSKKISVTCSSDGSPSGDYIKELTSYNAKGKKIQTTKDNLIKINKGTNYIRVRLNSDAKAGILNVIASDFYDDGNDNAENEIISLGNSSSVYAKNIIKKGYVADSYSEYTELLKKVKKSFEKECKGFNMECDEFYATLKSYDKSFFKKNSLCIYSCDIPESGKMTGNPVFEICDIDNKKTAQLSVTRCAFSGGVNAPAVSYYFVNVKKTKLKGVDAYTVNENAATPSDSSESTKQYSKWTKPFYAATAETSMATAVMNAPGIMLESAKIKAKWLPTNDAVVISTYSQYKKLIMNSANEIDDCLKGFDKSYFDKNNLVLYTCYAADSASIPQGAYLTKENINGVDTLVCSFVQTPVYGASTAVISEYCYVVQISKKDAKDITDYEIRRAAMFE